MGRRRKSDIGEYCVYLHIIPKSVTGYKHKKYYVGITKDINRRWVYNGEQYKGQIFYNAIQKYGWNNIKHKILYTNLSKEKAMELEKKMIVKYRSKIDDMGYNVSDGGEYMYYHYLEKDWIGKKSHKAFLNLNDYLYLFDCIEVSDF